MKRVAFLSTFLLLVLSGCERQKKNAVGVSVQKETFADNSELEEAKAISRKIYEGIGEVERGKLTRAEFQTLAKPLQRKLNSLIIQMEEDEVKELEDFKNKLMEKLESGLSHTTGKSAS